MSDALVVPHRGDVVLHRLDATDEMVLFDQSDGRLLVLNDLGAAIWYLIDGHRSVQEIGQMLSKDLAVDADQALADVDSFLRELEQKQLVRLR